MEPSRKTRLGHHLTPPFKRCRNGKSVSHADNSEKRVGNIHFSDEDDDKLWSQVERLNWDIILPLLPSDEEMEKAYVTHYAVYVLSWYTFFSLLVQNKRWGERVGKSEESEPLKKSKASRHLTPNST
jgi:hypothetical protein